MPADRQDVAMREQRLNRTAQRCESACQIGSRRPFDGCRQKDSLRHPPKHKARRSTIDKRLACNIENAHQKRSKGRLPHSVLKFVPNRDGGWIGTCKKTCGVAIIGAGPYGLSLAAHLVATGVNFRIFGKKLSTWRDHMPKGMMLKSDGFASNLSAPAKDSTLKAHCVRHGVAYANRHQPVRLEDFVAYADSFQAHYVPMLENQSIVSLDKDGADYRLTLEDGHICRPKLVVLAVGITWFKHIPELLSALAPDICSHSYDHHDVSGFVGRDVIVLGAGASAIDIAAALHEKGANVRIIARALSIVFHDAPDATKESLLSYIQRPPSGIGPGWHSFIYANAPLLFHRLPEHLRLRIVKRHLGPAPGWFMRQRIEGQIPATMGQPLQNAVRNGGRVTLGIAGDDGTTQTLAVDHVIAATGYRPDLAKLPFLNAEMRAQISSVKGVPVLSDNFETSLAGLYVVGPAAVHSFGPLMRFMVGTEFAAPRLSAHLARKLSTNAMARAA